MGRKIKPTNAKMLSLSEDLKVIHMPEQWHKLFDLHILIETEPDKVIKQLTKEELSKIDLKDLGNLKEQLVRIVEARMSSVFNEHLQHVGTFMNVWIKDPKELKKAASRSFEEWKHVDPVFAVWLHDSILDGSVKCKKKKKFKVTANQDEAGFIFEIARNTAFGVVSKPPYSKHFDRDDVDSLVSRAIEKIMVAEKYNPTASRGEKIKYISNAVKRSAKDWLSFKLRSDDDDSEEKKSA